MKKIKHLGAYGLVIDGDKILLINKVGGPYDGKLDLPGGTIEFGETPEGTLIREFKEEVGIDILDYELFDGNSTIVRWKHKGEDEEIHHIGFFYKVKKYKNEIKSNVDIDNINDDSNGARFYNIEKLNKKDLSSIAILELERLKTLNNKKI